MTQKFRVYAEQRALGRRIHDAGLTRYDVGESLGVAPSTVAGWLSGYNRMPDTARVLIELRLKKIEAGTLQGDVVVDDEVVACA